MAEFNRPYNFWSVCPYKYQYCIYCTIFAYLTLKNVGTLRGHSRSLEMAPFDRTHASSYSICLSKTNRNSYEMYRAQSSTKLWPLLYCFICDIKNSLHYNNPLGKTVANIFAVFFTNRARWLRYSVV